jgi:hypothetical protein
MDTLKLDDLMRRANKIDAGERRKLEQRAKAIRDDCAEVRQRLAVAESQIISLASRAARVKAYASQFRWDLVRNDGRMAPDVYERLKQLDSSMNGGLNMIREDIRRIDEFSEADLAHKWRPSKDVGGSVATAGYAEQMVGALERDLEYWAAKLEKSSLMAGGYEAIEGKRPENEPARTITNIRPGD